MSNNGEAKVWTIAAREAEEAEALRRIAPFLDANFSYKTSARSERYYLVQLRSILVRSLVEAYLNEGRPFVQEVFLSGSFRISVDILKSIPSAELKEVMALPDTSVADDEDDEGEGWKTR